MAMIDDLVELSQRLHLNVVLPVPPLCRQILDRAKTEGIQFGTVYIVCRPLTPGIQGSYDRETRDMWCHLDSSLGEEGQRHLVQCLFSLLASIQREDPFPSSIEDDWFQLTQAHKGGFTLAQAWGFAPFFTTDDQERLLERDRYHYRCHLAAGELAGHPDPSVARSAYFALHELRERHAWTEHQFEEALCGTHQDRAANALVTCFDRSHLRRRWLTTHTRPTGEPASFGKAAVSSPQAGERLRATLERTFHGYLIQEAHLAPTLLSAQQHHWLTRAENDQQLAALVALLNSWLIDEYPQAAVRMSWRCYTGQPILPTSSVRLYRGDISYEEAEGIPVFPTRTLWVLWTEPASPRCQAIEAAWQHFVLSWLTFADLQCAPLAEGLQVLWQTFQN